MRNSPDEPESGVMSRVHEGMHVVDASGEDVGHVEMVRMGDPEAYTTEGNVERPRESPLELVAEAIGAETEPDVPEPMRSRLIRSGYLKLDSKNLLEADRYVPGTLVRDVADDRVILSVRKDDLVKEH
jgi:hypothetical protein